MERVISATKARIHFGALMQQVIEGQEPVIVERGGKPQVVVLSIAEYERMKKAKQKEMWRETLAQAVQLREEIAARLGDQPLPPSEKVIGQMREERDEQLLSNLR
jgi:prevent-host-death family protein